MWQKFWGNPEALAALERWAASRRFPHCVILEGEAGCGKKTFAVRLGAAILCQGQPAPCGRCRDCVKIQHHQHPDLLLYGPTGASGRSFKVETVRQVIASAAVKPNEAAAKVYLLEEAHLMTDSSQNSLLKLIEEPPENVYFILTCTNRLKLLPTILSRATVIALEPLPLEECVQALREGFPGAAEEQCRSAAECAAGNLGLARQLLQQQDRLQLYEDAAQAVRWIAQAREYPLLCLMRRYSGKREEFCAFLVQLRRAVEEEILLYYRGRQGAGIPRVQAAKLLDLLEQLTEQAQANGNLTLLATLACAEMMDCR